MPKIKPPHQVRDGLRSVHTWQGAVVGDEAGHVYVLAVHTQVPHAAHELPVADGKVLREFGDASEEQRPRQVQGSERRRNNVRLGLLLFCIINIKGRMQGGGGVRGGGGT